MQPVLKVGLKAVPFESLLYSASRRKQTVSCSFATAVTPSRVSRSPLLSHTARLPTSQPYARAVRLHSGRKSAA